MKTRKLVALAALALSVAVPLPSLGSPPVSGFGHFYSVIREPAKGLSTHTVFRPADLTPFEQNSLPVVFWANGGCNASNFGFTYILTVLAARGFVVVANGAFDAVLAGGNVTPSKLINAINWIDIANTGAINQFAGRLDTSKLAVAGQSCGGLEALVAGAHPRIKTVLAFNTGFFPTPLNGFGREQLANLHKPTLIVNGGPNDVAYQNSIDNYNLLVAQGDETYLASNSHAGHSGLLFGIRDGQGNTPMLQQAEALAVNWLDYFLNGNKKAGRYFLGNDCGLCVQQEWAVGSTINRPDIYDAD